MWGYHFYRFCVHSGNIKTPLDQQYSGSDVAPSLLILNGTHFPSSHWILQTQFPLYKSPSNSSWWRLESSAFESVQQIWEEPHGLWTEISIKWLVQVTLSDFSRGGADPEPPHPPSSLWNQTHSVWANPSLICESDDRCSELLSPWRIWKTSLMSRNLLVLGWLMFMCLWLKVRSRSAPGWTLSVLSQCVIVLLQLQAGAFKPCNLQIAPQLNLNLSFKTSALRWEAKRKGESLNNGVVRE